MACPNGHGSDADDAAVVSAQMGRLPRGTWRVVTRCRWGYPHVIATAPVLEDGSPFPTLYWLTCPHLVRGLGVVESTGGVALWAARLEAEPELAMRQVAADAAYRWCRRTEGGGTDPSPGVGIAGQREPCATKCLHAHVAAYLAGIADPIGEALLSELERECGDERCSPTAIEGECNR